MGTGSSRPTRRTTTLRREHGIERPGGAYVSSAASVTSSSTPACPDSPALGRRPGKKIRRDNRPHSPPFSLCFRLVDGPFPPLTLCANPAPSRRPLRASPPTMDSCTAASSSSSPTCNRGSSTRCVGSLFLLSQPAPRKDEDEKPRTRCSHSTHRPSSRARFDDGGSPFLPRHPPS